MIKPYKTSRRRVGVVRPPSDATTSHNNNNTSGAAMSFLDDMLGGPSTSAITSSIGQQQQQQQQQQVSSGTMRTPSSPAVNVSNDIDEILELVSGGGGSGGAASKEDHSNNSGSRRRMGGAAAAAQDAKWSDPVFSPPSATTTTTTTTTTRRGRGNHDTRGRPSSSKSPLPRSGGGPRGSFHSSDGLPMMEETTTIPSPPAHHHHHLTDPPATTTTMRLTDSSSPSHRPSHNGGRPRAATKEEEEEEAVGNHNHHQNNKNDNVPPIPFFNTNHNGHDDETISQITTSVASNSFYDSQYGDSRNSGSYPWLRTNNSASKQPTRPTSQGDMSFADTLDEIADMLGPKCPRNAQDQPHPPFGRSRSGGSSEDPLGLRGNSNSNMRSKSPNDLFQSRSGGNLQSKPTMTTPTAAANRSAFDADEIYKRSKRKAGRMSSSSSSRTLLDMVEPTLGQLRLHLRYVMTLVVPKDFWRRESKKEDAEEGGEADYFNAIMRGNNNNPSSSARKPHHHHHHHGRGGRKRGALGYTLHLFGLFCFLTVVILLMRLAAMHTTKSSMKGGRGTRGGGGKRKRGRNKLLHTGDVRGHMAIRDSSGAGASSTVRGGMAHHSMGQVNGLPQAAAADQALEELQQQERPAQQLQQKNFQHEEHLGMRLPSAFDYLADITDLPVQKGVDIPFFWHIPRTGGGTINDIFGGCMSLTLASDAGGAGAAGQEHRLRVVEFNKHYRYVNVDTSTVQGIERAKSLGLAGSSMPNLVVSSLLHNAATMFTPANRGRMFTMFRHPVDRSVSLFHYIQDTQWRRRQTFQKELSDLTIDEYFKSGLAENNWMTRFLTNQITKGELNRNDLNQAKEVLRRKCLVGLLSEKGESFARFERFFGFPLKDDEEKECHEKKLQWAWPLKHRHDEVEEGTALWDLVLSHNTYDLELYDYAQTLFQEQAQLFQ